MKGVGYRLESGDYTQAPDERPAQAPPWDPLSAVPEGKNRSSPYIMSPSGPLGPIAMRYPTMTDRLMILPNKDPSRVRLVSIPEDISPHEAYRYLTGLISEVPREDEDLWLDAVMDTLEDKGFQRVDFLLGPALD